MCLSVRACHVHVLLVWCCAHGVQDHKENETLKVLYIHVNEIGDKGKAALEEMKQVFS